MKALHVCRHHDLVADDAGQVPRSLLIGTCCHGSRGHLTAVATTAPAIVLWPPDATRAATNKCLAQSKQVPHGVEASSGRSSAVSTAGTDDRAGHDRMVQCGPDELAATADAMGRAQDRASDRGLAEARRTTPQAVMRKRGSALSSTTQVSRPVANAPVSMLIRFGSTSGRSLGVCA